MFWVFKSFAFELFCCFCSVAKLCPTLCISMKGSMPDFPVLHSLLEFAQTHVHWVDDAIQPFHPLSLSLSPSLNLSQLRVLFQWVSSSHQVAKVLELQLQNQWWINEYSGWFPLGLTGLISFLAVQGTLQSLHQHHRFKHQFFALSLLYGSTLTWLLEKP